MSDGPKTEMLDVSQLTGDTLDVTFVVTVPGVGQKRYPMRQASMRVGRSDRSDIVVKDSSVSSRHCDLVKEAGAVFVRDLGSSNGTFLNDERISQLELRHGDVLRLGNAATIEVQIGQAPARATPAAAVDNENAGSTMMIPAGELDMLRNPGAAPPRPPAVAPPPPAPAPPVRRASPVTPAYASAPTPPAAPVGASRKGLFIGLGVGLGVLVVGVVAVLMYLSSARRQEDVERLTQMRAEVAALSQISPCLSVQDSVTAVAKLSQSAAAPALPARSRGRKEAERFIELQADLARQYERIIASIEQGTATSAVIVDRFKLDAGKLHDEMLRAHAAELATLLDERDAITQEFVAGWRKLKGETEHRASLVEALWVKGRTGVEVEEYGSFRFTRPAPKILGACRVAHDGKRREIEAKLESIGQLLSR